MFAIDPAESGAENPTPTREVIYTGVVNTNEEPLVVFNEFETDEGTGNHVYLIWNIETFLSELAASIWTQEFSSNYNQSAHEIESKTHRCYLLLLRA